MSAVAIITHHAGDRAKGRLAWKGAALQKMADKALREGVSDKDTTGLLRRYMDKLFLEHRTANNIRIHSEQVFIFANTTLITIFHLPQNLKRSARTSTSIS